MGEHYEHLSLEERCQISQLRAAGQSIRQIAAAVDRPPSTISRELTRNSGAQLGYKPAYAQEQARARRWTGSRLERDDRLRTMVLDCLARGWSPEQVAGRLARQRAESQVQARLAGPQRRLASQLHPRPRLDRPAAKQRPTPALARPLGSRSDALRHLRPGDPRRPRAQIPLPAACQAAQQSRSADRPTTSRLARAPARRAAPNHHLRQGHRVRSPPSAQHPTRYANLLLRY